VRELREGKNTCKGNTIELCQDSSRNYDPKGAEQQVTSAIQRIHSIPPDTDMRWLHQAGMLPPPRRGDRREPVFVAGPCDRRIYEPLARRTRGNYGFCMRDSRLVRRRVGLGGLVKDVGESVIKRNCRKGREVARWCLQ
jgi:hypothetical protein